MQQDNKDKDMFEITLTKAESVALLHALRRENENGNRFVAYPATDQLSKEDFITFPSAFDALQYAHENSTDKDHYIVRPIIAVQLEIGNKDAFVGEKNTTIKENKVSRKRSRNQGL